MNDVRAAARGCEFSRSSVSPHIQMRGKGIGGRGFRQQGSSRFAQSLKPRPSEAYSNEFVRYTLRLRGCYVSLRQYDILGAAQDGISMNEGDEALPVLELSHTVDIVRVRIRD